MPTNSRPLRDHVKRWIVRTMGALPESLKRRLAGKPIRIDGQELHVDAQLGMRLLNLTASKTFESLPLEQGRAQIEDEAWIFGEQIPVETVEDILIEGPAGAIPGRLYRPAGIVGPSAALVYFHGGGWVLGGLSSGDSVSRFLAVRASLTVISVDYRLAPENPFPAGVEDAIHAFNHVVANAVELNIDPTAIGIGGESAGGNLAAVVALETASAAVADQSAPVPAFQLLFMPVTDLSTKHRSYELFSDGFFLTEAQMDWYKNHYLTDPSRALDPRVSPLLAEDVSKVAPAYIAVAGFDVLRDEGEAYAAKMADAGVDVTLRRYGDLIHGMINATGVGRAAREALLEAAGVLRIRLTSHVGQGATAAFTRDEV